MYGNPEHLAGIDDGETIGPTRQAAQPQRPPSPIEVQGVKLFVGEPGEARTQQIPRFFGIQHRSVALSGGGGPASGMERGVQSNRPGETHPVDVLELARVAERQAAEAVELREQTGRDLESGAVGGACADDKGDELGVTEAIRSVVGISLSGSHRTSAASECKTNASPKPGSERPGGDGRPSDVGQFHFLGWDRCVILSLLCDHGALMAKFAHLLEPIIDDLYRYACRLAGDPVAAEDLLQAGLLRGLNKYGQLREASTFRVWMTRVLRTTWLNSHDKRTELPIADDEIERIGPALRPLPSPDEHVRNSRLGEQISVALDDLPRDRREAVWLVDGLGFTFSEAANILEEPVGTVASRVSRGRAALRQQLRGVALDRGVIA